jgi:hypothetical protein
MSTDNRKNPGIKIPFLDISDKPIVEETRCVEIRIPDDDVYMSVLAGLVGIATKWFNWQRDDTLKGKELARIWRQAYLETDWEQCMECADVAICIDTDAGVQNSLVQHLINSLTNNQLVRDALRESIQPRPGEENPSGNADRNLNTSTIACDDDTLAGAADSLAEWLHQNNIDWLEKISAAATPYTRQIALAENLPNFSTGVLGELVSAIFTFFSAAFKTNYEAAVDTPYLDRLKYDIWCMAGNDCNLTITDLYRLMYKRLGPQSVTIDTFAQGFTFAITGEWTGPNIANVMMFVQLAAFKFLDGFLSFRGTKALENALTDGFDTPIDDWMDWVSEFGECPNCDPVYDVTEGTIRV